ncbi:hypothetical protein DEU56DRAFT_722733 [Suillus clintonianus]|uniref:uncharacterized protein n=1 Tax=Suillus clintonianus TaxID=1904413 RepID=UPI001B8615E9|nr:uncharacterized protein DEU56DRAFT_722733 [Suillus clintonianus]KAG2157035.1 hypothetical protein DEU56DRAFT_722733 [Suillus clintonianus]
MGVTLVSISHLTAAGYVVLFRADTCKIFNKMKKMLGEIPVNKGLYYIKGPRKLFSGLAKTDEQLTMREIHSRLRHVAPESIRLMIKNGIITGIKLDPSDATMDKCDSCEYAKATRKPIGQIQNPPQCEKFSNKVHSDLWGPSPVKTPGHKEYFMSFTDD